MGQMMDNMKKAQEIAKQAEVINKELMGTVVVGSGNSFANNITILTVGNFLNYIVLCFSRSFSTSVCHF